MAIVILLSLLTHFGFTQTSFGDWKEESETNKRLLPHYGDLPKTEKEILSDSMFIAQIMSQPQFKTRREASDHLIELGFQYYYRPDIKTAMYRFNQAFLLDSTNTDIYWGYGAVYMAFGEYGLAKKQYEAGLAIDSANTHLLTDLGTYYMAQYYTMDQMAANNTIRDPKAQAMSFMDSAIMYLHKSYERDTKDVNTAYKLSVCYWNIEDCKKALKYFDEAKALGGRPITAEYTRDLEKRCK